MFNVSDCGVPEGSNFQGWVLTFASGLACCIGASVVYSDIFFQKFWCIRNIQLTQDSNVLVASLSLGAGVMFYSSFHTLMNESKHHFEKANSSGSYSELYMIGFYFAGVIASALINYIIHQFISDDSALHSHHYSSPTPDSGYKESNEHSPLLQPSHLTKMVTVMYDGSDDDLPSRNITRLEDICEIEDRSIERPIFVEVDVDESVSPALKPLRYHHENHRNDYPSSKIEQERSQLMRIGIQTTLAISIHKFPEGLVTFVSSKVSPSVGMALFFAIALHNISEGLTMVLPLYIATKSRTKSFLYTSLLGGLSQPLGALVGWFFLKKSESECWDHDFVYGALFGAVGGLMAVICIQGMLPPAIRHDKSNGVRVGNYFFLGVMIMGLSSALLNHARSS